MSSLSQDLVFLLLQFLDEQKYKETVHKLEQESGLFFNMRHFEDLVTNGEWEEVEKYLKGFMKVEDNRFSMKIFFEIRKQKYLEALDKRDRSKAVDILVKDLKEFANFNESVFKQMTQLLTLENFRDNEQLSKHGDTKSARSIMLGELKKLIGANPLLRDKLQFPTLKSSRLQTLINHSLNWQHSQCKNPRPNPDTKTLFVDHNCGQPNVPRAPTPVTKSLLVALPAHGPVQPTPAAPPSSLPGWMVNPPPVPHQSALADPISLNTANNATVKRSNSFGNEVINLPIPYGNHDHGQSSYSSEDLPKNVVATLNQGSAVKSMDFHPVQQILLLVGTSTGDVMIWEVGSCEIVASRNFKIWELGACSVSLQESLANDNTASVNRVGWSPDGTFFGVAYSKHIVHLYAYTEGAHMRNHLEIEAHVGNVYDIAFAFRNKQLSVVTCGEDRVIKVWDAVSGTKQYTFEGHEAPVFSICHHQRENIQFILSTATDGKIKAWLYENMGSSVDFDSLGHSSTTSLYSADGTRLFSCGTNEGGSFLVEWNESERSVKRTYHGLATRSLGVVQFDTTKNQILVVGDDFLVKFWDMNNLNPLIIIDADGGLPGNPCIKFHKDGMLLAVSTNDNGIKILANGDGIKLLRTFKNRTSDVPRPASDAVVKAPAMGTFGSVDVNVGTSIGDRTPLTLVGINSDGQSLVDVKPRVTEDSLENSTIWKLTEINEQSQCRSLKLPDHLPAHRVSRLMYISSGLSILALTSNAVHKLWKWQRNEPNLIAKATADVAPQFWQPRSGILMTNDTSGSNPEDAVPFFALSKNEFYVMSSSGGKISIFNLVTFKTMRTFITPPPAATCLAYHPEDNNVVAIGMDDSSVQIFNVKFDKHITNLKGHQKRITSLAFSNVLNVLVSSGADSQLCVWSIDLWEKQASKFLQNPDGRSVAPLADTSVQFHSDQKHLLAIHETKIAIFEAPKLECLKQWFPLETKGPITHATYSCDSSSIYVSFEDGSVSVLIALTLRLRCRINPTAYLPSIPRARVYPMAIAAHPSDPNQFALGLSDGGVYVIEPLESDGQWGTSPPTENSATGSDQPQR